MDITELPISANLADWQQTGSGTSPASRLLYFDLLSIGGTLFHCEAIEVEDEGDQQVAVPDSFSTEKLSLLQELEDGEDFQTVTIADRNYVIYLVPHSR